MACAAFPRARISANEPFFGGALTTGAAAAAPFPFPFLCDGGGDRSRGLAGATGFVIRCVPFDRDRGVADDEDVLVIGLNPFPLVLVVGRAALGRSRGRENCCGGGSGRDTEEGDDLRGTLGAERCRISSSAALRFGAGSPPEMEARRSPIWGMRLACDYGVTYQNGGWWCLLTGGIVRENHGLAPMKPDGKDSPREGVCCEAAQIPGCLANVHR